MLRLAVYYMKHVMVGLWCCSATAAKEVAVRTFFKLVNGLIVVQKVYSLFPQSYFFQTNNFFFKGCCAKFLII